MFEVVTLVKTWFQVAIVVTKNWNQNETHIRHLFFEQFEVFDRLKVVVMVCRIYSHIF